MIEHSIPAVSLGLLIGCFVSALLLLFYGLLPYFRAARYKEASAEALEGDEGWPSLSVVMYCQSDEEKLMEVLEQVTAQDYPRFDVVVVCDAGLEYAGHVAELVKSRFTNVYVTFVQPGSHNLSRRKLALTIGLKAAKGEVVLTTIANINVPSPLWLRSMALPFRGADGRGVDVALGPSLQIFSELRGPAKWFRQFDCVLRNALWMGYAAIGHPFRGDGFNMALRRKVFFDHKGYSKSMFLENGEDDIFIKEISTGTNARLVLSHDAMIFTSWGTSANRIWRMRKSAYDFTANWLPRSPFFRSRFTNWLQWLVPGLAVAASLTGWQAIWPLVVAAAITIAVWGLEIALYRRLACRFDAVRLWWAVVPFWFWRPVANILFDMKNFATRKKHFTWQR